jgi:hypothetical protein
MKFIPKVKTVKGYAEVGTGLMQGRLCPPGEHQSGKLPAGGFQSVWNFKNDQPNDYFSRKESPTSGGGKKVY